jgi:phosphoribosylaminoimidazole carboxylase (NCAIR synthetase)
MNHEAPWVVVIPGGQWQEKLVLYLKTLYRVAVVNPFKTETTAIADKHIEADILNVEEYVSAVKELEPVFITTDQCDIALEPIRKLADATHVVYHEPEVIEIFRDKARMTRHAIDSNIPTPKAKIIKSYDDGIKAIREIGYPFVLKPTDNNASVGIQFVLKPGDPFDIDEAIRLSYRKTALVQQFVEGRHLSVDGAFINGKHYAMTVGERFYWRPGVISRVDYTAEIPERIRDKIFKMTDMYANWSGANFGITHTEFILCNDTPYFCETALRGGGCGTSSHVFPWVSGFDPYEALVAGHLDKMTNKPNSILRRHATIKFFEFESGEVIDIQDNVLNCDGVAMWKRWVKIGDHLSPAQNGKSRHGCMIVVGNTRAEVETRLTNATKEIHVTTK